MRLCQGLVTGRAVALTLVGLAVSLLCGVGASAYQPVLHLRKAASPPPLVTKLQDPAEASAWYPSSPTWFGLGGATPDRNHTEILATYDDTALYIAFLDIDRMTVFYHLGTTTDLTTVDSDAIWIETPVGRRFYLIAAMGDSYPPPPYQASGEFPSFDPTKDKLTGWAHNGWYGGEKAIEQMIRISWSTLGTSAPTPGARWRVNFVNYNQTSASRSPSTVNRQLWAPGDQNHPEGWGILAFDEAAPAPAPNVSPEAVLTLRPGTGFGGELTLRAGNAANNTNEWTDEAITQSNWNDCDPIDYTIKEYMQFDLSMIPQGRKIVSATLRNHFRGHFESDPTDLYLHVVRLDGSYDPSTVTMLTSPLPVENSFRRLVQMSEVGNWIDFDVTDAVAKAFDAGLPKASFALAGSSGDIHNGKIWNVSFGRADWYDSRRPRLIVTFGAPGVTYPSPVQVGSTNYTSMATSSSKNKLTNGTFSYGTVEGVTNTTYWAAEPGFVYVNNQNVALMRKDGDVNPNTGHQALKFMAVARYKPLRQIATGLAGGKTYTFSGWFKGSASGITADLSVDFLDAGGANLGSMNSSYGGSGNWEQLEVTKTAPAATVTVQVEVQATGTGTDAYLLFSDFQLEEGSSATAYSETMGIYYPDNPRTDGTVIPPGSNCISLSKKQPIGSTVTLVNRVVTASYPDCFYIQCPESGHFASGIRVMSSSAPAMASLVTVAGTLVKDVNDEIAILASHVSASPGGAIPSALGCANASVGGGTDGDVQGPDGGTGFNMVGVLQTTWGSVSSLVPNVSMLIDDGSGVMVKVIGPTGQAANGEFVRVTGVSSLEKVSGVHKRVLRTRTASDVQVIGG